MRGTDSCSRKDNGEWDKNRQRERNDWNLRRIFKWFYKRSDDGGRKCEREGEGGRLGKWED